MRWSRFYAPTLRQDPADAETAGHRLLVRAGFIRRLAAGHYSLLPPAARVRSKIIEVIRQEMDRIGAQEVLLPALQPAELWRRSGRWDASGEETFRLTDRKGAEAALGTTHEEVVASLATELGSYRRLPQLWYQFQTAFRDEARPRSGLLGLREFTLKDAYSLDADEAALEGSFQAHREAYRRIFQRLGLPVIEAQGPGGSLEFLCPSEAGDDAVVRCPACGYAADAETAASRLAPVTDGPGPEKPERFDTPHAKTIEELTARHGVPADRQIKTLVYRVDGRLTLVLLRGDHALAERKLADATGAAAVRPADPEEIFQTLGAHPGSLGAVTATLPPGSDLPILADEALRGRRDMTTGANTDGVHVRGVDIARDIAVTAWADLRRARAGEPCPSCGQALETTPAIEVAHLRKPGRRCTEALGARVLGPDGTEITPLMGRYSIGVERAIAAIAETGHDDSGLRWPAGIAPFDVAVTLLDPRDDQVTAAAEQIYTALAAAGVETILDDRDERPGAKFADTELIGIPYRVTVGKRGLKSGTVEIKTRATGRTDTVPIPEAAARVTALLKS